MTFQNKILLHGFPNLDQLLNVKSVISRSCGNRQVGILEKVTDLPRVVLDGIYPIVLVFHNEGDADGMIIYDSMIRQSGCELLSIVFVAPPHVRKYFTSYGSIGAKGVLSFPLVPGEIAKVLGDLLVSPSDPVDLLVFRISQSLAALDFESAVQGLLKLRKISTYTTQADLAIVRCEVGMGNLSRAESIVRAILARKPDEIRVMFELIEVLKRLNRFSEVLEYQRAVFQINPVISSRVFDFLQTLIDQDSLDEAAHVVDELLKQGNSMEWTTQFLVRFMLMVGMGDFVPYILKPYKDLAKQYAIFESQRAVAVGFAPIVPANPSS